MLDKGDVPGGQGLKARLVTMAKRALQMETSDAVATHESKLDELMERQGWLDEMKLETQKDQGDMDKSFMSVCHGQPWADNVMFRYEQDSEQEPQPTEVIFTDFQSCAYGRAGQDVAHFLLSSTTREFRKNHLETILQAYLTELDDVLHHQGMIK